MTDRYAATALRILATRASARGSQDSIENIISDKLPNGALCWSIQEETLYRFDRRAGPSEVGELIIFPISGPGFWTPLSGSAALNAARTSWQLSAQPTITISGANVWHALPVSAGDYAKQVGGPAIGTFWVVDSNTGVMNYIVPAPDRIYHFHAALTVSVDAAILTKIEGSLSLDGEDIGTSNAREVRSEVTSTSADDKHVLNVEAEIQMGASGSLRTIQWIVRADQAQNVIVGPGTMTGQAVT